MTTTVLICRYPGELNASAGNTRRSPLTPKVCHKCGCQAPLQRRRERGEHGALAAQLRKLRAELARLPPQAPLARLAARLQSTRYRLRSRVLGLMES